MVLGRLGLRSDEANEISLGFFEGKNVLSGAESA